MARYVVRACPISAAGFRAAEIIEAEMRAAGPALLAVARFVPEAGCGAWVELVRSPREIAAVVAAEFAMGERLLAERLAAEEALALA